MSGQGSLFSSLSPFPPPLLPFIPLPIHLSCSNHLGSCHLIQLITDWDGLWETRLVRGFAQPQHTLTQGTIYSNVYNMQACKPVWIYFRQTQKAQVTTLATCSFFDLLIQPNEELFCPISEHLHSLMTRDASLKISCH